MTLGETREDALREQCRYIAAYYPGFRHAVELGDWGPAGTVDEAAVWIRRFAEAGVTSFICRFASLDQAGQLELFASEVLAAASPVREPPT